MHKESVHSKQKSRAISDISQPHGLADATQSREMFQYVVRCQGTVEWQKCTSDPALCTCSRSVTKGVPCLHKMFSDLRSVCTRPLLCSSLAACRVALIAARRSCSVQLQQRAQCQGTRHRHRCCQVQAWPIPVIRLITHVRRSLSEPTVVSCTK